MMSKKMLWAFLLLTLALPSLGFAMGECRSDRKKFCGDVQPGEDRIKQCMKEHYKDLSDPCKQMIDQQIEKKIDQKLEKQSN